MCAHIPDGIVSGGQTGADRAGLQAAIELGLSHGGWCPKGRRAEDGRVPIRFELNETPSEEYSLRTKWNVRDSDATVLFTRGAPTGGSALTKRLAEGLKRPVLHLDLSRLSASSAASELRRFLSLHRPRILNVAGSRESQAPGIQAEAKAVILLTLDGEDRLS